MSPAKEPAQAPPPGIVCPRCGCRHMIDPAADSPADRPWRTTKTERHNGYVRRRRECRNCGWTVYTREAIETDPTAP